MWSIFLCSSISKFFTFLSFFGGVPIVVYVVYKQKKGKKATEQTTTQGKRNCCTSSMTTSVLVYKYTFSYLHSMYQLLHAVHIIKIFLLFSSSSFLFTPHSLGHTMLAQVLTKTNTNPNQTETYFLHKVNKNRKIQKNDFSNIPIAIS